MCEVNNLFDPFFFQSLKKISFFLQTLCKNLILVNKRLQCYQATNLRRTFFFHSYTLLTDFFENKREKRTRTLKILCNVGVVIELDQVLSHRPIFLWAIRQLTACSGLLKKRRRRRRSKNKRCWMKRERNLFRYARGNSRCEIAGKCLWTNPIIRICR